jgi:hypothetical protein
MQSSPPPFVLHALPISCSLTWSFQLYFEKNTSYESTFILLFAFTCHLEFADNTYLAPLDRAAE